jgi:hypothetical protein
MKAVHMDFLVVSVFRVCFQDVLVHRWRREARFKNPLSFTLPGVLHRLTCSLYPDVTPLEFALQ